MDSIGDIYFSDGDGKEKIEIDVAEIYQGKKNKDIVYFLSGDTLIEYKFSTGESKRRDTGVDGYVYSEETGEIYYKKVNKDYDENRETGILYMYENGKSRKVDRDVEVMSEPQWYYNYEQRQKS